MNVTVGGKEYVIEGILYGTMPAVKHALTEHVRLHISNLQGR